MLLPPDTEQIRGWIFVSNVACDSPSQGRCGPEADTVPLKSLPVLQAVVHIHMLPRWLSAEEPACQCRRQRRHRFHPWVREDPPEKGTATHSSVLAWRIPWTGEPGGLHPQSGSELDMTETT